MNHCKVFCFILVLLAALVFGLFSSHAGAASQPSTPWSLIGFTSIYTPDRLKDIFTNRHSYQDSYLAALALNYRFARPSRSLGWEWEVQGVRHFGRQNHFETNALILARWYRFPWNDWVATTLAVGEGLSYAFRKPRLERKDHDDPSQLLNYLLFELTLSPEEQSRWYFSTRIHHRSGVFGLYNGVRGGSNFIGMGVGYRF
ncbi:MAG TPA: hypothetical protein ENN94_02745 [Geoalkalibacter subterraneus]|uniref:Lipid A 3-O-deacylase n=1 Tax=Geoalkalibacter subterraneus TaxID=483547 RepID=A0A831L795_9BACT|nr:hypothetical protein [Geoalkalibacter subterraneus]